MPQTLSNKHCIAVHAMPRSSDSDSYMKQAINREAVRLLVQDFGYQEAARRLNLKEARLRQMAKRGGWNTIVPKAYGKTVTTASQPAVAAEAHADALADYEGRTRLSLAKGAERMAKDCEDLPARHAKTLHTVAQSMAIIHRQGEHGSGNGFTLNVLNMGALQVRVGEPERIDQA